MTVVGFYPLVYSIYISLTNYNPAQGQQGDFIGLDNYVAAFSDGLLWHSLLLTALFTVLSVGISLCLAILLALLFNKQLPGFLFLRTIVLVPMLVTPIAVGIIWRIMMMPEQGSCSISCWGCWASQGSLGSAPRPRLSHRSCWSTSGNGRPSSSSSFSPACGDFRAAPSRRRRSTAPHRCGSSSASRCAMLKPVIIIATLLRIIDAARTYDTVFIITRGGPDFATDLASIYLQRVNFQFFDLGYGSALVLDHADRDSLIVVLVFVKLSGFLGIVSEKEPA